MAQQSAIISPATTLEAGVYTVVASLGSCTASSTVLVEVSKPVVTATPTPAACFGGNGMIMASTTGGLLGYNYVWNTTPASMGAMLTAPAGTYTVTVTDGVGCTKTESAIIAQPTTAVSGSTGTTAVPCNGGSTGSATVTATGGTGALTYLWSNGAMTDMNLAIVSGTYTVTVTDANLCTFTATATVTQPTALSVGLGSSAVLCNGSSTGSVTATASGGVATYTYVWNNGIAAANNPNIAAGTYTVTATDSNLCTTSSTLNVGEPAILMAMASNTNISCFGAADGTATATSMGGVAGYTYMWSDAAMQTTAIASNLAPGTYIVTSTDANMCTATTTAEVTEPNVLAASFATTNVLCFGSNTGALTLTATGGTTAYTYSWSHDGALATNAATSLYAGVYTVFVSDNNNCTTTASIAVAEPTVGIGLVLVASNQTSGTANGAVDLTATGGAAPYTYAWDNGAVIEDLTGVPAGTYCVTVTDNNGCTSTACAVVTYLVGTDNLGGFATLQAFPNPTEGEFKLHVAVNQATDIVAQVFGVTGQAVTQQTAKNTKQHTFNFDLSALAAGVYYVRIQAGTDTQVVKIAVTR